MTKVSRTLIALGLAGLAACSEAPLESPRKPQPSEASKQQLLAANEILTACTAPDIERVKALLIKDPALVNAEDDTGATPLARAVGGIQPSAELVKLLLERGAKVEGSGKSYGTPLQLAAGRGRKDLVVILLEHGAKIGALDRYGRTALSYAASGNRVEVADLLMARGAAINIYEAAALGKTKKLQEFLRSDPGSVRAIDNPQGLAPLHWAAMHGHSDAVRLLLAHGASAFQESRYGYTPCFFAREYKHTDIVALMRCP